MGVDQADRYLDHIDSALNGLVGNPLTGSDCFDLLHGENMIFVIRILHQSMDIPRHLGRP